MFSKGFTLVEILVALSIFVLIISATFGVFTSILFHQRRLLAQQELLNQTSYLIEYIGRSLRFVKKDGQGVCLSQTGFNYENPGGNLSIVRFINHLDNDVCQEFFLDNDGILNELKEQGLPSPLVSEKIQINELKFKLAGARGDDFLQPRVTIFLEAQVRGGGQEPAIKAIELQTTISQRNIDE